MGKVFRKSFSIVAGVRRLRSESIRSKVMSILSVLRCEKKIYEFNPFKPRYNYTVNYFLLSFHEVNKILYNLNCCDSIEIPSKFYEDLKMTRTVSCKSFFFILAVRPC